MVDLEVERHWGWRRRAAREGAFRWKGDDGFLAIGDANCIVLGKGYA